MNKPFTRGNPAPAALKSASSVCGFTLAELLVVVAIVAVLVAIAIPVFMSSLESSKEATCQANRRSMYGEVVTTALSSGTSEADEFNKLIARPDNGYTCPDDGKWAWDATNRTIVCSKHRGAQGIANDGTYPNDTLIDVFNKALEAFPGNPGNVDSTAPNGTYSNEMKKLLGDTFNSLGIKSWAIINENSTKTYWWTDVDIAAYKPGDKVRVIRYNPNTGNYTAGYATLTTRTADGDTYNVFQPVSGSTWTEIAKGSEKYQEALDAFNEAPLTPAD